jgi:hypothetical protein
VTILDFLTRVWQGKPDDQNILIWTLQNKRSRWFTSIADAADHAADVGGSMDVYVGVGLAGKDHGSAHRCVSSEITGICGIAADFDLLSDAHVGNRPGTIDQALMLVPPEMPPTIIIGTGNGIHCWWLLKEPYIFDGDEDRTQAAELVGRWHSLLKLKATRFGWAYERLADLARVLRIPSTQNFKDPANPKPVTLHSCNERRYNLSDFEAYLEGVVIPDLNSQTDVDRNRELQFAGKDIAIQLDAAIPQDVLEGWMAADPRFRSTWLRQRRDLKDRSQSGYDLALANFGVDAGLTEQQIVDLIVQHRRSHAQKARTKIDYYARTISAAKDREGGVGLMDVTTEANGPQSGTPIGDGQDRPGGADPEAQKARLCDRVSKALGVQTLGFVKITGQDPTYHMNLGDGTVIEFSTFARFTNQDHVRNAIGAVTNRLVPRLKPRTWGEIAQAMLDALVEKAGGDETDMLGSTRIHLHRYLSDVGFIDAIEDQPLHAQRRPTVLDGAVAIAAADFQMYVNKTTGGNITVKAITSRLAALGAESVRPRSGSFRDQSRWLLPVDGFKPEDYLERKTGGGDVQQ